MRGRLRAFAGAVGLARRSSSAASTPPIPILLYHSVTDRPPATIAPFAVTPASFERHLDLIVDGGHEVLSVSSLAGCLRRGQPPRGRPVVITFDDGFADVLEIAAPMLQRRRLPATVYLTTGYLAGRTPEPGVRIPGSMMPWRRVRELKAAGLEVGAHSHSHPQMDVLSRSAAAAEMRRSRELLEAELGHPIRHFAFPHGYASRWLRREVQAAGFESGCGVRNMLSHPGDDLWCLARLTVRGDTPPERFAAWLRGEGARLAPAGEALRTRGWRAVRRARATLVPWRSR